MTYKPQHKHISLRTGEIAHGTILEASIGKDAIVRLPHGDFTATLSGKLKKGDSLFFKILETEPRLVLKIFAASTKNNGQDISADEMLRILDIPVSEFNRELLVFLKSRRTIINREEFLAIYKLHLSIPEAEIKQTPEGNLMKALFYINDSSMQFTPELFSKIKLAFSPPDEFFRLFKLIDSLLPLLPKSVRDKLTSLYSGTKNIEHNLSDLLGFITGSHALAKKDNNLYNLLAEILSTKVAQIPALEALRNLSLNLLQSIEQQYYLNNLALQWNSPIYLFLPVIIRGNKKLARIIVKKMHTPRPGHQLIKFSFELISDEFGEIVANVSYMNNQISIGLFTENNQTAEFLREYLPELESSVKNQNFIIKSITVNQTSQEILDSVNEFSSPAGQNISVVI